MKKLLWGVLLALSLTAANAAKYDNSAETAFLELSTGVGLEGLSSQRAYVVNKFGRNDDISTNSDPQDVWQGSEASPVYTGQPTNTTPETITCTSTNTADTSAGTGARTIRIQGLRDNTSTAYTSEDLIMNGTGNVTTTNTWWRINRGFVLTAGTGGENAGSISCNSTTTTTEVFFVITPGTNQTTLAAYTVPAEKIAVIKRLLFTIGRSNGAAGSANMTLRIREPGGVYRGVRNYEVTTSYPIAFTAFRGAVVPAGSDIKARVERVSDNGTIVSASFELLIFPDIK